MNEGCDTEELEVTATSSEELRTQAEGAKKQNRQEKAASSGGAEKDPEPEDGAKARGRAARGRGRGRPTTWVYRIAACALASPREARMRQKQHSGASSKPQSRHPRPRPWPEGKGSLFVQLCCVLLDHGAELGHRLACGNPLLQLPIASRRILSSADSAGMASAASAAFRSAHRALRGQRAQARGRLLRPLPPRPHAWGRGGTSTPPLEPHTAQACRVCHTVYTQTNSGSTSRIILSPDACTCAVFSSFAFIRSVQISCSFAIAALNSLSASAMTCSCSRRNDLILLPLHRRWRGSVQRQRAAPPPTSSWTATRPSAQRPQLVTDPAASESTAS